MPFRFPDEEVVVLSQVLACNATLGYEDMYNVQVRSVGYEGNDNAQMRSVGERKAEKLVY